MESVILVDKEGDAVKKKNITVKRVDQMCRVCLGDKDLMNLFSSKVEDSSMGDIFYICTSIKPLLHDFMPKNICIRCIEDLVKVYAFICKCKKADESLKTALVPSSALKNTPKSESKENKNYMVKEEQIDTNELETESFVDDSTEKKQMEKMQESISMSENQELNVHNIKVEYSDEEYPETEEDNNVMEGSQYDENEEMPTEEVQNESEINSADGDQKIYDCKSCKEIFPDYESLENHKQNEHSRLRIECKICNVYFENRKICYTHAKSHDEEYDSYLCNDCGQNFEEAVTLLEHLRQEHDVKKPSQYLCYQCGTVLKTKNGLSMHMLTHSKVKPNVCAVCGASFSQKRNLVRHEMTHTGERPFVCEFCGKGFIQKVALQAHLNVHSSKSKRPPKCKFCLQIFDNAVDLRDHYKEYHNQHCKYEQKVQPVVEGEEKPKNFVCIYCSRKFASTATLRNHLLIHTGEKPHVCNTCGKRFRQLSHLSYHTLLHTGARNHVCNYCGKAFTLKGNLTVHVRTHTGETPYKCNICTRGYYDSSNLRRHKETQHGILRKRDSVPSEDSQMELDESSNLEVQHELFRNRDYKSNDDPLLEIDDSSNLESQHETMRTQEYKNYEGEVEIEYEAQEDLSY